MCFHKNARRPGSKRIEIIHRGSPRSLSCGLGRIQKPEKTLANASSSWNVFGNHSLLPTLRVSPVDKRNIKSNPTPVRFELTRAKHNRWRLR